MRRICPVARPGTTPSLGNPLDPAVPTCPMACGKHLHRVLGHLDVAKDSDARLNHLRGRSISARADRLRA